MQTAPEKDSTKLWILYDSRGQAKDTIATSTTAFTVQMRI